MIKFITNRDNHLTTVPKGTVEECIDYLDKLELIGIDTENSGLSPHTAIPLLIQVGDKDLVFVIDATSVDISFINKYKDKTFIGQNLKYDYGILKKRGIILTKFYDLMIAEQVMGMGSGRRNSLDAIIERRLGAKATYTKSTRSDFVGGNNKFIFEDRHIIYAAEDISFLFEIKEKQKTIIDSLNLNFKLYEIEFPLIPVLAECEYEGLNLNEESWKENIKENKNKKFELELALDNEILQLSETEIKLKGGKFTRKRNKLPEFVQNDLFNEQGKVITIKPKANIEYTSHVQLKKIFTKVGENVPLAQNGKETVGSKVLVQYIEQNPESKLKQFCTILVEYSNINKELSSFGENFLSIKNRISGKFHTSYRQCHTVTGRFSSGDMDNGFFNSQQIPKKNKFRTCFYSEGYDILTIDLAGAELVILASLSNDKKLIEFLRNDDAHSPLATECYNQLFKEIRKRVIANSNTINENHIIEAEKLLKLPKEESEKILREYVEDGVALLINKKSNLKHLRNPFKNVIFGVAYGASEVRISEVLGVTNFQAKVILNTLKTTIPDVFKYLELSAESAIKKGFVLLSKRTNSRRWFQKSLDAIKSKIPMNFADVNAIKREAMNAPIQGTNAEIIKEAIVKIDIYLKEHNIDANLLLQVHDELVYRFPKGDEEFPKIINKLLIDTANLYLVEGITMGAEYHVAEHWQK